MYVAIFTAEKQELSLSTNRGAGARLTACGRSGEGYRSDAGGLIFAAGVGYKIRQRTHPCAPAPTVMKTTAFRFINFN